MDNEILPQSQSSQQQLESIRQSAETSQEAIDAYARLMREQLCGMYLFGVGRESPVAVVPLEALKKYVDDFVVDQVGDDCSSDPVLRLLIEQLILANQVISRLYADAIACQSIDTLRTKIQLAISLTGELRRLSCEIKSQSEHHRSAPASIAGSVGRKKDRGKENELGNKMEVA